MFIETDSLRWPIASLAPSLQMARQPSANEGVDVPTRLGGVSQTEVFPPAFEVSVDLLNQFGQWFMRLLWSGHLPQGLPLAGQGLGRRFQIQIPGLPSVEVSNIPKRVAQKIQARFGFLEVDHSRFVPVDNQSHPPFQLPLNEPPQLLALVSRQNHKVVRVPHQFGF